RYNAFLLRFRLITNQDDIETVERALQLCQNLRLCLYRQSAGGNEVDAGLIFNAGSLIDQLGVGESRYFQRLNKKVGGNSTLPERTQQLPAKAVISNCAEHADVTHSERH